MKIFPGIIRRQHRSETHGVAERAVRRIKGHLRCCCNQVWTKNGGRIPWNAPPICETFKISCLMGRHPMKGVSKYHLLARLFLLERWHNITPFMLKTCRDSINSVQKSCQVNTSTRNLCSHFWRRGVNWLVQLQFLAPVELFYKQLNGCSF